MAAMRVSGQRLRQMVHDAGLRHGAEDRLQTVLETGWWMAVVDANYDSQLDRMIVDASNKFTIIKKLADDIAVLLQPARPGSSLPATLIGLHGRNLFQALVALRLPANATKNVHLEVALAPRRLALREFVDLHIHVYEQFVYIGIYKASEDATTLAFLNLATKNGKISPQKSPLLSRRSVARRTKLRRRRSYVRGSIFLLAFCNHHCDHIIVALILIVLLHSRYSQYQHV